ncbi:MAG: NAD(P)H-dependent oxidoreductase subunit E, partial [Bacteroidia bacterium]|nr:NAD(P)H-dependent oxidoreductase subunit E [Bacteroidia bacterium]
MSENLSELSGRKGLSKNLFEALGKAASDNGTPAIEELERIRAEFLLGKASVYGAVSFYDFLKPENKGKKVYVCNGSACMLAGTQEGLRKKLEEHFLPEQIGEMCCLGRCHENNAFHIDQKNYSGKDIEDLPEFKSGKISTKEKYYVGSMGNPILTKDEPTVEEYYKIFLNCL